MNVVRILQTEAYSASQEWKTVEPRRQNQTDKPHTGHAITVKDGKYQTTNRFEILSDTTDSEINEIVDHHERNNEGRRKTAKHQYGKSSNVSTNNKHKQLNQKQNESQTKGNTSQSATVIIVGDCIIKHLDKRRLQRSIAKSTSFPGPFRVREMALAPAGLQNNESWSLNKLTR